MQNNMMKRLWQWGAIALLIAISPLYAQQGSQEETVRLANQIRKSIVTLNNFGVFDNISFQLANGVTGYRVTLKGYASRPTLKSSAEQVVKKIELVESVDNQIEVLPVSRQDENIRLEAYARIYGNNVLSRYNPNRGTPIYGLQRRAYIGISQDPPIGAHPIHIIVKNGNITLEGVVDTEGDKTIAGMMANQVQGAFAVTNNLQVLRPSKK